jgi:hypothetical protein
MPAVGKYSPRHWGAPSPHRNEASGARANPEFVAGGRNRTSVGTLLNGVAW